MKRPTWATIVGVLGIVFGCFGLLGAGQEMMMPTMLKFQKEMFANMEGFIQEETAKEQSNGESDDSAEIARQRRLETQQMPFGMFKSFQKMLDFPDWYNAFSVISGFVKLMISAVLLFAAISMLQLKLFSINLFYWATGSSIGLAVVKGIALFFASSFVGFVMMFGGMFGIVIDIVLLIVVITGEKEAFGVRKPIPLTY